MSVLRKLLLTIMVMGATTSTVGAGTFASFNASTSNAATFATGTLVLTNDGPSAGVCMSTAGGIDTNANPSCDALFALTVQKPGDSAFADLTLTNSGTLSATTLKVNASQACVPGNAPGQTYNGAGDPCSQVQLYIQEYTSASNRASDTRTLGTCHYGAGLSTLTSCAFDSSRTLDTFDSSYPDAATQLSIGSLNAGASRYFRIYLTLPSTADNTYQGRQATFGFNWAIAQ
jgi:spore coat-associated protein N